MTRPGQTAALAASARQRLASGHLEEAEALCLQILEIREDEPNALLILAATSAAQQRAHEAATLLLFGRIRHPETGAFHRALSDLYLGLGDFENAIEPLESCVLVEPAEPAHRARLVAVYETCRFTHFRQSSKLAMLACLRDGQLSHALMQKAWLSLFRLDPESRELAAALDSRDFEEFESKASSRLLDLLQRSEFLTAALGRFVVSDFSLERGLGFLRRYLLQHPAERKIFLPLTCVLARYCFATEYVLSGADEYSRRGAGPQSASDVALLACYEPIFRAPGAERWASLSDATEFRELLLTQLEEPLEEARLAAGVEQLTTICEATSLAVQAQYEENPYPRWSTLGRRPAPSENAARLATGRQILVAGCGSGREAADAALFFPNASVLGIDLSRPSLAYGLRRARELALKNLAFAQADLLELPALGRTFDFVVCSGVLHHLSDTLRGLRALLAVLRPSGVLRVALYSTAAREHLTEARAAAQIAGFSASPAGIRAFRETVRQRAEEDPIRRQLVASTDFYSLSGCRDLVFHVQERTFSLREVRELSLSLDLELVRVETKPQQDALYRRRFPEEPSRANWQNWELLEREQPLLFSSMYCFWFCRRSERETVELDWILSAQPGARVTDA